jgi:two-component system nitrogen regulation response regulator GlnG
MNSDTPIKVLCVEDNETVTDVLQSVLEQEKDMQCVGCLDAADRLIEAVVAYHPDVIIYDLTMPGRNTFDALREMSARFPEIPVIAFSGYDDAATKLKAIDAGAWSFLSKHGDFQLLLHSIRRLANIKPAVGA